MLNERRTIFAASQHGSRCPIAALHAARGRVLAFAVVMSPGVQRGFWQCNRRREGDAGGSEPWQS